MLGAIAYTVAFAGLILGCLIAATLTEPSHDPLDERLFGDLPRVPGDDEFSLFHAATNTRGGQ